MKQTPEPQDWHDVGKLLGRDPLTLPRPITKHVDMGALERLKKQAAVCPVCLSPHPADVACKPLEKSDNGYTLTRRE